MHWGKKQILYLRMNVAEWKGKIIINTRSNYKVPPFFNYSYLQRTRTRVQYKTAFIDVAASTVELM